MCKSLSSHQTFLLKNRYPTITEAHPYTMPLLQFPIPKDGETVENTVISAPVNEHFLAFDGASNIRFQGIRFGRTSQMIQETSGVEHFEEGSQMMIGPFLIPLSASRQYGCRLLGSLTQRIFQKIHRRMPGL